MTEPIEPTADMKSLVNEKILGVELRCHQDEGCDGENFLVLTMESGKIFHMEGGYGGYTGKSCDEYKELIKVSEMHKLLDSFDTFGITKRPTSAPLTTEQQLKAIIKSMHDGGHKKWSKKMYSGEFILSEYLVSITERYEKNGDITTHYSDLSFREFHILEILLDTDGLKAAYNKKPCSCKDNGDACGICGGYSGAYWRHVSQKILQSWNSGNNVTAALETAYDLLPSKL